MLTDACVKCDWMGLGVAAVVGMGGVANGEWFRELRCLS